MIAIKNAQKITENGLRISEVFHFDDDYRRVHQSKSLGVKHIMVCDDVNARASLFGADFLINNFRNSERIFNFLAEKTAEKRKIKS
jgi:FMN phosphatase YigB (HAD superfamily)